MDATVILLIVAMIILGEYLAEWIFRRFGCPDLLVLILVGILLGPSGFNLVDPAYLVSLAPLFTTFTLLFMMFEGALSINLRSLARGFGSGLGLSVSVFLLSSLLTAFIIFIWRGDLIISLLLGAALGGVSSAFVIPVLQQIFPKEGERGELYSILVLESSITDVLAIVCSLSLMELKLSGEVTARLVIAQIAALFSVAGLLGLLAGCFWIFLEKRFLPRDSNYNMTIAYAIILYFLTETAGGNGAMACLFLGLVLTNAPLLLQFWRMILQKGGMDPSQPAGSRNDTGQQAPPPSKTSDRIVSYQEKKFYREISFFLKTFFFVYVGLMINFQNKPAVYLGLIVALVLMLARQLGGLMTRALGAAQKRLVNAMFARGLAPVAIALIALQRGVIVDSVYLDIIYLVVTATIILSSIKVFLYRLSTSRDTVSK